jgi:uncharacterized membrane protein HdeD (DUF308 family)
MGQQLVPQGEGYIKQIPLIGIFNIIQASLELMMGVMLGGIGIFMGSISNNPQMVEQFEKSNLTPQVMIYIYVGLGVAVGAMAVMRLVSGILTLRKRGRIFAIVTSIVGLAAVFTCYCAPTSIALAIYSLIVLVQPAVIAEYERVRQSRQSP